jgi:hypothetical protein
LPPPINNTRNCSSLKNTGNNVLMLISLFISFNSKAS